MAEKKKKKKDKKKDKPKGFKAVQKSIEKTGKSKDAAARIAYSIGKKKYGKAGMANKAAAGRRKTGRG
tara:strand:+ start:198 stop:401 length:204 start_codon:yes stop_codon:yes gene_type:complete